MKIELDSNPIYDAMLYEALLDMESITEEMLECMDLEMEILEEASAKDAAAKLKTKSLVSNKSLLGRLMAFIKRIIAAAKGASAKFYKLYNKWLQKAKENIDSVNFENLAVTLDKNYIASEDKIKSARNFILKVDKFTLDKLACKTMDEFIKKPQLNKYVDANGSLAGGCKNYFRYGSAKPRLTNVKITGQQLKEVITGCIAYCLDYETTLNSLNGLSINVQNIMKTAESVANRNEKINNSMNNNNNNNNTNGTTQESFFSELEETFINLEAYSPFSINKNWNDILIEAELNANQNNNQNNTQQDTGKPNVTTGDDEAKKANPSGTYKTQEQENEETVNSLDQAQTQTLTFLCKYLQIVFASALTVAEERYSTYIKLIRYALSKSKFKYETNATQKGEQDIIDKDQNKK